MCKSGIAPKNKGLFGGTVISNRSVGERFYRLSIGFSDAGGEAFKVCVPGQFAQLDLSEVALPSIDKISPDLADSSKRSIILRRPFSFSDVRIEGAETIVEILYCVVGPASLRMTSLSAGDNVSVIGPLGNGFTMPEGKTTTLLVVGGMGAGPLQYLANFLKKEQPDLKVVLIAGAKSKEEFPFEAEKFCRYEIETVLATDDGSVEFKGFVTDCIIDWLDKNDLRSEDIIIYSCGPEVMLGRVAEIAAKRGIDCQVSMERRMACGIGLCQSCAVEYKTNSNETVYKLCCMDGPVFDSKKVVF